MTLRVATFLLILSQKPVRLLFAAVSFVGVIVLGLHTSFCSCSLGELLDDTLEGELDVSSLGKRLKKLASSCAPQKTRSVLKCSLVCLLVDEPDSVRLQLSLVSVRLVSASDSYHLFDELPEAS